MNIDDSKKFLKSVKAKAEMDCTVDSLEVAGLIDEVVETFDEEDIRIIARQLMSNEEFMACMPS